MQLRNFESSGRGSDQLSSNRLDLRRLWIALFILSMAPPVAWGVGSGSSKESTSSGPSEAAIRASDDAAPKLVAASIVRSQKASSQVGAPSRPSAAAVYSTQSPSSRALQAKPERRAVDSTSPAPVLRAQAAPAEEAAPLIPEVRSLPDVSEVGATSSRTARQEGFVAEDPRSAYPRIGEEPTSEEAGAQADPNTVDGRALRAAPPERRMRNAMHRVAASTAATLSTQASFTDSTSPSRFTPGAAADAFDRGFNEAAEAVTMVPGVRLESVSLGMGYSSNGIPGSAFSGFGPAVGSDYDTNISATFSARHRGRTSQFALTYTPNHQRRARLSEWNTTNHRLSLSTNKELGRRWAVGATANVNEGAAQQFAIEQPIFRTLTDTPDSLEGLFEAVRNGQMTDEEFASALTGTPIVVRPAQRRLGLARILSLNTRANASYTYSPRVSFDFSGGISTFRLTDNSFRETFRADDSRLAINSFVAKNASASANYRLSARRSVSLRENLFFREARGPFGGSRASTTSVAYQERLGRSWSYGVSAGLGLFTGGRPLLEASTPVTASGDPRVNDGMRSTWVASGNLGYRLRDHSFSFSAGRRVNDAVNVVGGAAINAGANWNWSPRRAAWSMNAGAAYFQTGRALARDARSLELGRGFGGLEARMLNAGFSRRLTTTTAFQTNYQYGRYSSPFQGLFNNRAIQRVQVSFVWRPVAER